MTATPESEVRFIVFHNHVKITQHHHTILLSILISFVTSSKLGQSYLSCPFYSYFFLLALPLPTFSLSGIWGIYQKDQRESTPASSSNTSAQHLLRKGDELVAAGYAIYGPATMIVLSTGHGVHGFTLDPSIGEFLLTHRRMRVPRTGKIYSLNEGNLFNWDEPTREFVRRQQLRSHRGRYIGSMVLDVHRTLLYGGVFAYPGDKTNTNGKLRLLYECNPIAFLVEQAGGKAVTGSKVKNGDEAETGRILNVQPKSLHQKCPIWLGSVEMIEEIEELYDELHRTGTVKTVTATEDKANREKSKEKTKEKTSASLSSPSSQLNAKM